MGGRYQYDSVVRGVGLRAGSSGAGLREEVGAEDLDEFLGGFGEFGSALFEEEDFPGRAWGGEGAKGDAVSFAITDGEFRDDGISEVGGDHGEGGFELVTLEARGSAGDTANFEGLIAQAVSVGEVDKFVGVEVGGQWGIFAEGELVLAREGEEEGLTEHELGLQGEALLVIGGDVAEDGEFHGAFGDEADEVGCFSLANVDGDGGVLAAEFREKEWQQVGSEGRDDAEVDGAGAEFPAGGELLKEAVFFGEEAFGVLEEKATGIGGDDAAPAPGDELLIELGFQVFDALADGGLADAALAGGATHGPGCDDFLEVAELLKVHEWMVGPK